MDPATPLPLDASWSSPDDYIASLLKFTTSCTIFRNLCGGVHILDFLTRKPDLYTTVLPPDWRGWFDLVDIDDVLELLLRANLEQVVAVDSPKEEVDHRWRGRPPPPASLIEYIDTIRRHCLRRDYKNAGSNEEDDGRRNQKQQQQPAMARHVAVGMKPKKQHEVAEFASFVHHLAHDVALSDGRGDGEVSIVDFGSGQNYLGRTLASPPYERQVIAIERRHHNVDGARGKDVLAKLAKKEIIMRNKKEFKRQVEEGTASLKWQSKGMKELPGPKHELPITVQRRQTVRAETGRGSITYVEAEIEDGRLEHILYEKRTADVDLDGLGENASCLTSKAGDESERENENRSPPLLAISLHSCGNLLHHGLRSLTLNPNVHAVAMIGCCYNLMTERLGPATYKHPQLRPNHPRLEATGSACDPHGFPMSRALEEYRSESGEVGVRLNITARMMAVQAPYNWGEVDSEMFFRRHFYRALLQRILLDRGVVRECCDSEGASIVGGMLSNDGNSLSGKDAQGTPLIVGSLKKACFASFSAYVMGALDKLQEDPVDGPVIKARTADLTNDDIAKYEANWGYAKKNLAVIWSLMAFSAGVVESVIVVDRWLFLKEQDCVERCWVQPVFNYQLSPRNLVVVGVKKRRNSLDRANKS